MGANDTSEMLQAAKEECLRLEGELERTRSIAALLEADGARLQARIDAAEALYESATDGSMDTPMYDALVSEEPAPEQASRTGLAFRGWCEQCRAELEVDTVMRDQLKVFCPNMECLKFVQTFWVER